MTDVSLPSSRVPNTSGSRAAANSITALRAACGIAAVILVLLGSAVYRQRTDLTRLRSQLGEARAEVAVLDAQLALMPVAKPAEAQGTAPRSMPVSASFERSFWGDSYTLHMKNVGTAPLNVEVTTSSTGTAATPATIDKGPCDASSCGLF